MSTLYMVFLDAVPMTRNCHVNVDNFKVLLIFMILWTLLAVPTFLCNISLTFFLVMWVTPVSGGPICFFLVVFADLEVTPNSRRTSPNWPACSSSLFCFCVVSSSFFGPYPHIVAVTSYIALIYGEKNAISYVKIKTLKWGKCHFSMMFTPGIYYLNFIGLRGVKTYKSVKNFSFTDIRPLNPIIHFCIITANSSNRHFHRLWSCCIK